MTNVDSAGQVRFSERAWARNEAAYVRIRDMAFNKELLEGTLSLDRFRFYIVQDAKYLVAFAQALALAAAKADAPARVEWFARAATDAIVVERGLHADYFRLFGVGETDVDAAPASPACHHYCCFLLASGYREPLPVHVAGLLPCFWIYREVGRHIHARAAADNPYRAWIDTYAGEDFAAAVDAMIDATDALARTADAGTVESMHRAFTRATQLEWLFWDSAHRREEWPL